MGPATTTKQPPARFFRAAELVKKLKERAEARRKRRNALRLKHWTGRT